MIIKRTIKFSIQNQRGARSRLRMRVSYDGNRLDFQTGIILDKDIEIMSNCDIHSKRQTMYYPIRTT